MKEYNFDEAKRVLEEKNLTISDLETYFYDNYRKYYKGFCIGFIIFFNILPVIAILTSGFDSTKIGISIFLNIIMLAIIIPAYFIATKWFAKVINPYKSHDEVNSYYFIDKTLKRNKISYNKYLDRVVRYKEKNK